jgi:prepilin-type N-terminal cleavage/methylation domain-containing protein
MWHSRSAPYSRQAGFTLVELLLALLMFALIAGTIFASFAAIADGVEKGRQSGEVYRVARGAIMRFMQEIGAAFHEQVQCLEDSPSYICEPLKGERDEAEGRPRDRIMFLTIPYRRFPAGLPASEVCNVCYYIAENTQRVPALFRYEDCTLDKKDRERCGERQEPLELTDMVVGLALTYYDAGAEAHDTWPPRDARGKLPCRVHVALTLQRAPGDEQVFTTTVRLPMGQCDIERGQREDGKTQAGQQAPRPRR